MISLKDLAKECNVSVATASKALHDYPDIGSKKRDFIKQKARELGYYPNSHASALKNNKSRTISLMYGDLLDSGETGYNLTGDYFSHVFESFREEADLQSYGIILSGFYAWDKRRSTYADTYANSGYSRNVISSPGLGSSGRSACETISETEAPSEEIKNNQETISVSLSLPEGEKKHGLSQAQLLRNATRTPAKMRSRRMSAVEYCRYRAVDGVVLAGVDFASEEIQELLASDLPVVTLDYISQLHSGVSCDLWTGMENLVSYIYSLGHRSYIYLHTGTETGALDKLEAFEHAMRNLGIREESFSTICLEGQNGPKTRETLSVHIDTVMQEIVQGSRIIDVSARTTPDTLPCLICSDDLLAFYAIRALSSMGMIAGRDISVAGYGGNKGIKDIVPDLTTLEQDTAHIGRLLAGRLIDEIEYPLSVEKEHTIVKGILRKGKTIVPVE